MNKYVKEQNTRLNKLRGYFWDSVNENNHFTVGKSNPF